MVNVFQKLYVLRRRTKIFLRFINDDGLLIDIIGDHHHKEKNDICKYAKKFYDTICIEQHPSMSIKEIEKLLEDWVINDATKCVSKNIKASIFFDDRNPETTVNIAENANRRLLRKSGNDAMREVRRVDEKLLNLLHNHQRRKTLIITGIEHVLDMTILLNKSSFTLTEINEELKSYKTTLQSECKRYKYIRDRDKFSFDKVLEEAPFKIRISKNILSLYSNDNSM